MSSTISYSKPSDEACGISFSLWRTSSNLQIQWLLSQLSSSEPLKLRTVPEDFVVQEIPLGGTKGLKLQKPPEVPHVESDTPCEATAIVENLRRFLHSEDFSTVLRKLEDPQDSLALLVGPYVDKEHRREIHQNLRELGFEGRTEGSTIGISLARKRKRINTTRVPPMKRQHLHFTLYKSNIDTQRALSLIAKGLYIKPCRLAVAGNKDKRAVTVQRVSCRYIPENELLRLATKLEMGQQFFIGTLRIGDCQRQPTGLRLGELQGNQFRIQLRPANVKTANIFTRAYAEGLGCALNHEPIPNFFGPQRFGACKRIRTYHIGAALLKGQWLEAIRMQLKSTAEIKPAFQPIADAFGTDELCDLSKKTSEIPGCYTEVALLERLSRDSRNPEGALVAALPRRLLMLYIHSLQSFLWNTLASRRLKLGLHVQIGDLICEKRDSDNIRYVTETDLESQHSITLTDVVLPVPGIGSEDHSLVYPTIDGLDRNSVQELLQTQFDISLNATETRRRAKRWHFSGTYRSLLVQPWECRVYLNSERQKFDEDQQLCYGIEEHRDDSSDGLWMEFCLPAGSYATSVLREFCQWI